MSWGLLCARHIIRCPVSVPHNLLAMSVASSFLCTDEEMAAWSPAQSPTQLATGLGFEDRTALLRGLCSSYNNTLPSSSFLLLSPLHPTPRPLS